MPVLPLAILAHTGSDATSVTAAVRALERTGQIGLGGAWACALTHPNLPADVAAGVAWNPGRGVDADRALVHAVAWSRRPGAHPRALARLADAATPAQLAALFAAIPTPDLAERARARAAVAPRSALRVLVTHPDTDPAARWDALDAVWRDDRRAQWAVTAAARHFPTCLVELATAAEAAGRPNDAASLRDLARFAAQDVYAARQRALVAYARDASGVAHAVEFAGLDEGLLDVMTGPDWRPRARVKAMVLDRVATAIAGTYHLAGTRLWWWAREGHPHGVAWPDWPKAPGWQEAVRAVATAWSRRHGDIQLSQAEVNPSWDASTVAHFAARTPLRNDATEELWRQLALAVHPSAGDRTRLDVAGRVAVGLGRRRDVGWRVTGDMDWLVEVACAPRAAGVLERFARAAWDTPVAALEALAGPAGTTRDARWWVGPGVRDLLGRTLAGAGVHPAALEVALAMEGGFVGTLGELVTTAQAVAA